MQAEALNPYLRRPDKKVSEYASVTVAVELEPKVMAAQLSVRGEVPRAELLQRKRQRIDAGPTLSQLLMARGMHTAAANNLDLNPENGSADIASCAAAGDYATWLPVEAFDDAFRFEELSPEDWAARVAAAPSGLPCLFWKLDHRQHQRGGIWASGRVVEVDVDKQRYHVLPDDVRDPRSAQKQKTDSNGSGEDTRPLVVPRVFVCFAAEDPENFANRFAAAHKRRTIAEAALRTELYVDSIPLDEYAALDPLVIRRVLDAALSTPALVESESNLNVTGVLEEVRAGYSRIMNADLFHSITQGGGLSQLMGPSATSSTMLSVSSLFVSDTARPVPDRKSVV